MRAETCVTRYSLQRAFSAISVSTALGETEVRRIGKKAVVSNTQK